MKKVVFFLLAGLYLLSLQACGNNDEPQPDNKPVEFKCMVTELAFPMSGGDNVITVVSPVKPEVSVADPWATIGNTSEADPKDNIYKITVTAAANPDGNERSTVATVKAGAQTAQVSLNQSAKPMIFADEASLAEAEKEFPAAGGTRAIKVSTNVDFRATSTVSWIKVPATKTMENFTVRFSVETNHTSDARSGSIVIAPINSSEVTPLTVKITQEAGNPQPLLNISAKQIAADMHAGINIGNTLEAINNGKPSETAWGQPKINEKYIQGLKDAGFNAVRIPCAWDGYIIDQNTYEIDPAWLDRVNEVVGYCISRDMYAIVNIHWDGGWLENNIGKTNKEQLIKKQSALWTQIANRLGAYNERLLFAGTNEPGVDNASQMSTLLELEQAFIDAVRATGGNNLKRTLVFQGPSTDIQKTETLMTSLPKDAVPDRLMAEIHYYTPYVFCMMDKDESWGKMAYFWGEPNLLEGSDRNYNDGEKEMKDLFDKMKAKFTDNGIPVIIGEYGALKRNISLTAEEKTRNLASRAFFNECVSKFGKERGMVPFLWDTGEIISRTNGGILVPELVEGIMKGSEAGKYPF